MERVIRTVIIMAAVCAFLLLGTCFSAAAQKPVQISTYQQLSTFIDGINDGSISADRNATLTKDITVPDSVGNDWTPLSKDSEHAYQGTFDGKKHTISGAKGAAFMEPGAIVGETAGSLTGCYFCADTTGAEVTYATCEDVSQQGLLTLQQMTGEAPKIYMADLMEPTADDYTGTVWKTMADTAKAAGPM